MLQLLVMTSTRKVLSISFVLLFISTFGLQVFPSAKVGATPGVTITSPTPNQSFSGTNFTVTGTATPNTTVVVSNNGLSFAQTISNASGVWSINSSLPAGQVKITAKAIENPTYGYFPTTTDFQTSEINRIRLSDNSINPGGSGWPVASATGIIGLVPSTAGNYFYGINPFTADRAPTKFNPGDGVDGTAVVNYPADSRSNIGAYANQYNKYFSANIDLQSVSVVNTTTNTWVEDIPMGGTVYTVWESPAGKLYAVLSNNQVKVINPATNTVEKTISVPCTNADSTSTATFSQDLNYPYYFVPCITDGTFIKFRISDDSVVSTLNVGLSPSTGALSLDNKRLFFSSIFQNADSNKLRVVSTEDGSEIVTKTLTAGSLGFLATSDFQKIYITTPGNTIDTTNIDVMNTSTYDITPVSTPAVPGAVSTLPTETTTSSVDVALVLGASTPAPGMLAETGVAAVSGAILSAILLVSLALLYRDYRRHKRPLAAIDPNVHYTFAHHIRVVSIPLARYRLTFKIEKKHNNITPVS